MKIKIELNRINIFYITHVHSILKFHISGNIYTCHAYVIFLIGTMISSIKLAFDLFCFTIRKVGALLTKGTDFDGAVD